MKTLLLFLIIVPAFSFANFENYDQIVDKLSKYDLDEDRKKPAYRSEIRSFSRAHIGLGIAQTFYDADAAGLDSRVQNQGGLLINVGVDVLSSKWGIEGSYANYGRGNTDNTEIKLREFALKGLYKPTVSKNWAMRLGLGVSSRFLDISNSADTQSYRTPSGLFLIGVDSYISSFISVGADLKFKTAMIDDTIDNNSVDLAFRVDTHF
ncbi:MAG: outer membrane beta-barrel protein [Pseudomonadota bacterium]